jgi:hypothetical protein
MKIIRGTQDAKGNVFEKQPDGGTGRMRCMKCHQLVTPQTMPDGKQVMQCGGCGATHTSSPMDRPQQPMPGALPKKPTPR